jgi:tetratricopeptide (TPR) repeat protein
VTVATDTTDPEVIFPQGFDPRWESEMTDKGYLSDVVVRLEDGSRFLVNFIDPVRLSQDLQSEAEAGSPYFAEPGMIVVPQVTRDSIVTAVQRLNAEGFFETLRPLTQPVPHPFERIKAGETLLAHARTLTQDEARSVLEAAATTFEQSRKIAAACEKSALIFLGRTKEELGERQEALQAFNQAIEIDPDDDVPLVQRGLLLYACSEEAALDDFRKAISRGTDFVWPYYYLARHHFAAGDRDEGIRLSKKALENANREDVASDLRNWIREADLVPNGRTHVYQLSITPEDAFHSTLAA